MPLVVRDHDCGLRVPPFVLTPVYRCHALLLNNTCLRHASLPLRCLHCCVGRTLPCATRSFTSYALSVCICTRSLPAAVLPAISIHYVALYVSADSFVPPLRCLRFALRCCVAFTLPAVCRCLPDAFVACHVAPAPRYARYRLFALLILPPLPFCGRFCAHWNVTFCAHHGIPAALLPHTRSFCVVDAGDATALPVIGMPHCPMPSFCRCLPYVALLGLRSTDTRYCRTMIGTLRCYRCRFAPGTIGAVTFCYCIFAFTPAGTDRSRCYVHACNAADHSSFAVPRSMFCHAFTFFCRCVLRTRSLRFT